MAEHTVIGRPLVSPEWAGLIRSTIRVVPAVLVGGLLLLRVLG